MNRVNEIIKRTVIEEFTNSRKEEFPFKLEEGDDITLIVLPSYGKPHLIKTKIFIDGVPSANQDKVCHAAGGYTTKTP